MYKTIIMDVDGTLIDTEKAVLGSLQKMLAIEYNKTMELEELEFVWGIPGSSSLPVLGIEDTEKGDILWNVYMKEFMDSIHVFAGIRELLSTLHKRNIQIGIVTSKTKIELEDDFVPFGLMEYLSFVVCADDTLLHKPNPEPIQKFLEISGADPSSSIYIGDTMYDYQCARDAGVSFGLAVWGAKNNHGIEAKHFFNDPNEVLAFVSE
ncbi:HAD family hydrolase [Paenibacillus glacialis]|uniref:HAD family hydrolase n=1 Tax=Paenibacillus glacialis TaxID=494026 RepID=A0A168N169_9BACL|nr:HAD family hydrolase [Paenibacillus glacialis]OAB45275.1 HAD family hydrolase [Paenibacillus glacialis]